jgi:hypothetical protein
MISQMQSYNNEDKKEEYWRTSTAAASKFIMREPLDNFNLKNFNSFAMDFKITQQN